jgi:capsular polysaccharide transport system permease protein
VVRQTELALLARGWRTQLRVISALVIRELQSRFGRENFGFLWLLIEPLLLAGGVTVITYTSHMAIPGGLNPLASHIYGYITYMQFRSNVIRAASLILSNRVLMYHRHVTILDMVLARSILEFGATLCALLIFIFIFASLGFSPIPERPLMLIFGMAMMAWYTTGLALVICALTQFSESVERIVHPLTYLSLPFSGMFFRIDWLPAPGRDWISWFPLPQITEIVRQGVWGDLHSDYVSIPYLLAVNASLTFTGLLWIRAARARVKFE